MVNIASNILRVRENFSAMRRLQNWLRRSMKTDRLTSLALMNIHHDIAVDYDEVAKIVFSASPQENQSKKLSISII